MATKPNKVKFNLKNVHVAKLTVNADDTYTYGTPRAIPGAVSLIASSFLFWALSSWFFCICGSLPSHGFVSIAIYANESLRASIFGYESWYGYASLLCLA